MNRHERKGREAVDPWSPTAIAKRLAELHAEAAARVKVEPTCPRCGCSASRRCGIDLGDGSFALCAIAGQVPGRKTCSACLTPEKRCPNPYLSLPAEALRAKGAA